MRVFLFKILFRITWWIAPNRDRVNKFFDMYIEELEKQEAYERCQQMQKDRDSCIRSRTETYEWLTTKKQRDFYLKGKPIRGLTRDTRRSYTDYDEWKAHHNSEQIF